MFDVGFAELLLIAIIGLIVIGPKRMPEAVRFLGYWIGKLRRSVQNARQDMEREFGLDEIRRDLHNEALLSQLDKERQQIEKSLANAAATPEPPATIVDSAEMQQAFDDFDKEFGDDTGSANPGTVAETTDAKGAAAKHASVPETSQHASKPAKTAGRPGDAPPDSTQ